MFRKGIVAEYLRDLVIYDFNKLRLTCNRDDLDVLEKNILMYFEKEINLNEYLRIQKSNYIKPIVSFFPNSSSYATSSEIKEMYVDLDKFIKVMHNFPKAFDEFRYENSNYRLWESICLESRNKEYHARHSMSSDTITQLSVRLTNEHAARLQ